MVMMLLDLESSYLFPGIKCVKPLLISARDMLTSKKGLRWRRGGGLLQFREEEARSMQTLSSKERTECENIRHADGVGMEMGVRRGEMTAQSSRAICEAMRKCVCTAW